MDANVSKAGMIPKTPNPNEPNIGVKLTDMELDALKEVANIGSGNASMALSSIFNKRVNISIPDLQILKMSQITDSFKNDKSTMIGIFSRFKEGMDGNVFLFLPTEAALNFVSSLKGEASGNKQVFSKDDEIVLKKASSIIYSAYITGIAKFFEQRIIFSEPDVISALGSSVIESLLVRIDKQESLMMLNVNFVVEDLTISGEFTMAITLNSLAPLLTKIRKSLSQ